MMDVKKGKRLLILEAAYRLFVERGYTQTKITDIAKEVNIGKGTVYEYFRSKEEIFSALFEYFSDEYIKSFDKLAQERAGLSIPEKLKFIIEFDIGASECIGNQFPPSSTVELELFKVPGLLPLFQRFIRFKFHLIHDCIREGIASGDFVQTDPVVITMSILGALAFFDGFSHNKIPGGLLEHIDQCDCDSAHVVEFILNGLKPH